MADFNVATGKEQPINRTGLDNVQVSGSDVQGTLVGVDTSGADPKLVPADADADASTTLHTVGALFPREIIEADMSGVNAHPWDDVEKQIYKEERTLTGDRATVIRYGIEMVNDGTDLGLTPGEPVYLAPGGGFTQTKPTASGDIVQAVGIALTPEDMGPGGGDGRERILLDIDKEYETLA